MSKEISFEVLKLAARCPLPNEARMILHLTPEQFGKLLGLSPGEYWDLISGKWELPPDQKAFLVEAIRIAKEKGFI